MKRLSLSRFALLSGLVTCVALATANCHAKSYITCTGLCESVLPPCSVIVAEAAASEPSPYQECLDFCTALQNKCERVGQPAVFLDYVACVTDAGFSCTDAGDLDAGDEDVAEAGRSVPIANAPCGIQQAQLIQCEPADGGPDGDARLDIPDGIYAAGSQCPDSGGCLACCEAAYPMGAKEYRTAVTACACGSAGKCRAACMDDAGIPAGACAVGKGGAPDPMQPTLGGRCDLCLTTVLDLLSTPPGACVDPVIQRCNGQECAYYQNCVNQAGCTN